MRGTYKKEGRGGTACFFHPDRHKQKGEKTIVFCVEHCNSGEREKKRGYSNNLIVDGRKRRGRGNGGSSPTIKRKKKGRVVNFQDFIFRKPIRGGASLYSHPRKGKGRRPVRLLSERKQRIRDQSQTFDCLHSSGSIARKKCAIFIAEKGKREEKRKKRTSM